MKKFLAALLIFIVFVLVGLSPFFADAQIVPSIPYTLTNGSLADATQVMGNFNTIVTDVNANAATNGANTNITSITGLTTPLSNTYGGTVVYTGGTTGGSANVQTLATVVPSNFALTAGNIVTGVAGFTNTTSPTLSVNAQAATQTAVNTPLGLISSPAKTLVTGQGFLALFDGTYFEILSAPPNSVANSQLALMSNNTFKGNISGGDAVPSNLTLASTQQAINAFIKLNRQTFTGNGTYTPCTGIIYADMEVWGGGGAGGNAAAVAGASGGGGGSGGYAKGRASAATIGGSQAVTIGAAGGTSSIGSIVSATGGSAGANAAGATAVAGGAAGAGSAGDIQKTGMPGGAGFDTSTGSNFRVSGYGGNTMLGGGGLSVVGAGDTSGSAAVANSGSGGSGATSNGGATTGGAGGTGYATVTEYCNQ